MIEAQTFEFEPKTCADCPNWKPSDRTPNTGNCPLHQITTLGHEPAGADCLEAFWAVAESNLPLHQVDRSLPPEYRWSADENRLYQFVRSDRMVFDVSIQHPYRKLLGQIELVAAGWKIIRTSDRQPYTSHTVYATYRDAAEALLKLSRNIIDRANGRLNQLVMAAMLGAIAVMSVAPSALAYRGSGRVDPPQPKSQSQPYVPPDRGAPEGTVGSGTR